MKRGLVIGLVFLVSIGLSLAGFGLWCLGTTAGTRWLIGAAGPFSGIGITTAELEGSLLGGLELKELRVAWEGGQIQAGTVKLALHPFRLWSGVLPIEELAIDRLVLQLDETAGDKPPGNPGEQVSTPTLTVAPEWLDVTIDRLKITGFSYRSAATPAEEVVIADLIAGRYRLAEHRLVAQNFAYHSPYVELDGEFDWELTRPHLVMTAKVHLPESCVDPALFAAIEVPTEFPGHLELDGDWNGYAGPVRFGAIDENGNRVWLSALATGSWRGIRFADLKGSYLGGAIAGNLDLSWIDSYRMHGQLSGRGLDPLVLIEGTKGQATFDVSGELLVPYDDQPLQASVEALLHEGHFQGHAVHGRAAAQWTGETIVDLDVDLTGDGARLWAKGVPAQRVEVDLEVADLAAFHAELAGRAAARGWLSWSGDSLAGEIDGHGDNLAWHEIKLRRIEVQGRHRAGEERVAVVLSGDDWSRGPLHLKRVVGDLSGTVADHQVRLAADGSAGHYKVLAHGRYRTDSWTGQLERLTGDDTPWGKWSMPQPAPLAWEEGVVSINKLLLNGDEGARLELDVKGWGSPSRADVALAWAGIELEWLQPYTDLVVLTGRSDGEVHYTMRGGRPLSISGQLAAHGRIENGLFALGYEALQLGFAWDESGLQLTGTARSDAGEVVQAKMKSTGPLLWQWPVAGLVADIQWQRLDLARFRNFLDDGHIEGQSEGSLSFAFSAERLSRVSAHLSAHGRMLQGQRELGPRSLTADLNWDAELFQCAVNVAGALGGHALLQLTSTQDPALAWPASGQVSLEIDDLNLAAIEPFLPHDIEVAGLFDGQAEGAWRGGGTFDLAGKLHLLESHIDWSSEEGRIRLPVQDAVADWTWSGDNLTGSFSMNLARHGDLKASWRLPLPARMPPAFDPAGRVQVTVSGRMQAIGLLSSIGPWLMQDVHGETSADLVMQGTWAAPDLRGQIVLRDGGAYLPAAGVQLDNINIQGDLAGDRLRIEQLEVHSGPGVLNGKGELLFDRFALAGYRLKLIGNNLQVFNFPELQVLCNPDLELAGNPKHLSVQGSVLIPLMAIRESKTASQVQASKDVVVVTKSSQREKLPFATDILVAVELGDDVTFKSGGVDTRLTGGVIVSMTPTGELQADGEIQLVAGTFRAYGASLVIRHGVLNYTRRVITNPELRIFAAREVGSVLAGVQVTGNAEAPVVTLYSRPAMPERDILGYILMGRAIRTETQEADILMMGAGSLLPGGTGLAELGITQIDLQGLFSGTGGVRLRRPIAEKWEIESTLGIESGIDLYYIIEFE